MLKQIFSLLVLLCVALGVSPISLAQNSTERDSISSTQKVSRYLNVHTSVNSEQLWTLNEVVNFNAGKYASIYQALSALLHRSGYKLDPQINSVPVLRSILNSPVPHIHRKFDNNKAHDIARALIGPTFNLVVDPINRLVNFELRPEYAELVQ